MRAACHIGTLWLMLACARPPSTKPLGGEEWLRPEHTSDRRPHGPTEQARALPAVVTAEPAEVTSAAPSPTQKLPSAVVKPGEVELKAEPLLPGSRVTLDTRFKLVGSIGGMSDTAVAEAHERIEVRILDATADAVREVEVNYVTSDSSFRFGGGADEQTSNAGKRVRVRFDSDKPQVTVLSAGKQKKDKDDDDDEKGIVFDLATVTGYLPLVRPHLPAKLGPGFRIDLDKKQLGRVFGEFESAELERAWLTLRGLSQGSDPVAEFDCGMPIRLGRDGFRLSAELTGRCSVNPRGTRPVDVSLSGPLRMEASNIPGAQLSGTIEASIHHSYSR